MVIDTSQLSEEDKKKWEQIKALANQQDENGNYVNQKLHDAYDRLDSDSRTFVIVDQNLGGRTAGQFTITDFNGPNDFSKATVALNFRLIKGLGSPSTGDFDSTFKKYEGLFAKMDSFSGSPRHLGTRRTTASLCLTICDKERRSSTW